ncbi:hypothetical protein OSC52_15140 [Clostridium pasteurianum]|uniref:hypothetical protein n=1 Tax=Clostridium pasteurianum TaxID=1501 RepID=UPI0022609246|nr:hypothetical protein [Clostridium pasteurianum]UZW13171.1 hypothetical protein OSC52_15140 [Clostridium pasteurianum]
MPVIIIGIVEDVQTYQGKNGFGANITMSTLIDKRRKSLTFNNSDRSIVEQFEENLQHEVTVKIALSQSNFGLRLGDIMEVVPAP